MRAPSPDRNYHLLSFADADEGATFLAALSRFIDSPRGNRYAARPDAPEVWTHRPFSDARVELYLSDSAFDAAVAGFGTMPLVATRIGSILPPACSLALGDEPVSAWGSDEARRHTSPPAA